MEPGPGLASLLADAATAGGGRPALASASGRVSYAQLAGDAEDLALRLRELAGPLEGAGPPRVAVVAPNVPALVVALFAVWQAGAVAVPLSARLREYELRRILSDAGPSALVCLDSWRGYSFAALAPGLMSAVPSLRGCIVLEPNGAVADELAGSGDPQQRDGGTGESIAAILYTSGTTGDPKGALVEHSSALHGARQLAAVLDLDGDDASLLVIPITHAFGFLSLLAVVASAGTGVLVDSTFSLEPLLEAAARHGGTVLHGSPALFAGLLKLGPARLGALRTGLVGGAPCPPALIERLDGAGARILNVFGMTEIGAASVCRPDDPPGVRYHTVGRALPGYELRVVPRAGEDGELGELQVRGPHVTPGYFRRPELTAEAFDGDWFRTGDLGSLAEGGYLTIAGRHKELVHVAGFNVFPAEVETFLLTHPDVTHAAVIGVPHERTGEALHAFLVPREGSELTPGEVIRFARAGIAGYKLPYAITIVPELPLLASGKPDRGALARSAEELRTTA